MKLAIGGLAVFLVFVPALRAEDPPASSGPAPAREAFDRAVGEAEAAWREDVIGALRVYASRLLDAERAATRKLDLDGANRVREVRESVERLAAEAAAFESLVGLLPVPGEAELGDAARDARAACREKVDAANGRYRDALAAAAKDAKAELDRRLAAAAAEADLDGANAIADAKAGIDRSAKQRLTPLEWREITFPTKDVFLFRGEDYEWRVQGNELVGSRFQNEPHMDATLATYYARIESVTVRGRIRSPATANFRMSAGPLNMILNWERGPKSILRWYDAGEDVPDRLVPGRFTDITVRQTAPGRSDVLFDGRRIWSTENGLFGAITIYTYVSAIGVTDLRVLGVPDPVRKVTGPTARLW